MIYIGILWNTVNNFYIDILKDLTEFSEILFWNEIDLENQYNEFIKSIYELDGIDEWKVNLKLQSMNQTLNKKIVIVFLKIDDNTKIFNSKKNKIVSVNIENLKYTIRKKYSEKIPNYFFDNIFHMTDNDEEILNTLEVLREWFPDIYTKYKQFSGEKKYIKEGRKNEN